MFSVFPAYGISHPMGRCEVFSSWAERQRYMFARPPFASSHQSLQCAFKRGNFLYSIEDFTGDVTPHVLSKFESGSELFITEGSRGWFLGGASQFPSQFVKSRITYILRGFHRVWAYIYHPSGAMCKDLINNMFRYNAMLPVLKTII